MTCILAAERGDIDERLATFAGEWTDWDARHQETLCLVGLAGWIVGVLTLGLLVVL